VQMPGVPDPGPFHLVWVHQLTSDVIEADADPAEEQAELRPKVEGACKRDRGLIQLFFEEMIPAVAAPHQLANSFLRQSWDQPRFMDIGWGNPKSVITPGRRH